MTQIENKILSYLESGYKIDIILEKLNIDEEFLADIIIELENKGLIVLENKNWILTEKGKDLMKEIKEELKRLKIGYLYGEINKEEFQTKRKELEPIIIDSHAIDTKSSLDDKEGLDNKENINCSKCGKTNKPGSKYCFNCGELLRLV